MHHGSNNRRIILSVAALVIFLVLSSFLGNYLLASEAKSGGMDVEWKVPLPNGFNQMLVASDHSIIVAGAEGKIQEIGTDGATIWTFNSTQPDPIVVGEAGLLYFVDRSVGQDTVYCLYPNGTQSWSLISDVPVAELCLGRNGDVYLNELRNNFSCLVCLNGEGFYKWIYAPEGGINNYLVLSDGTVIARNTVSVWNITNNFFGGVVKTHDNLTAISDDGTILWEKDILMRTDPIFEYLGGPFIGPGSTFDLRLTQLNGTMNITEFDRDGRIVQTIRGNEFSRSSWVRGDIICVIDTWQEPDPEGVPMVSSRITAYNATTGELMWERQQNGSAWSHNSINGNGTVFRMQGEIVLIGQTGMVIWNFTSDPGEWNVLSADEHGVLLADGHGMIGKRDGNGSMIWQLSLESQAKAGFLGHNGDIVVITDHYVIAIHQPVLSTTMNYLVVLLAIDLFVTLMSIVRIIDMIWPSSKARIE
jgi:outer membrane protein assembly factor BamB